MTDTDKNTITLHTVLMDDSPMTLAMAFLEIYYKQDGELTLRHWQEDLYAWDGSRYSVVPPDQFNARLWKFLQGRKVYELRKGRKYETRYVPNQAKVENVKFAIIAECQAFTSQSPCWLDANRPHPSNIIAFKNGLLDVSEWIRTEGCLLRPPSPLWFSVTAVPYEFRGDAQCPKWLKFLNEVFDGDAGCISLLQEYFGLMLTTDTSMQKLLMLIGAPRSGKGTICRTVERVVGAANIAWPTLSGLGSRFGPEALLDKNVAIVGDAHLSRDSETTKIVEFIKGVVGEDRFVIDRKNRAPLPNVKLSTRFIIAGNELPQLADASAALSARMMILPMPTTFAGRENRSLDIELAEENSGIAVWALAGLVRLRASGKFTEPQAATDVQEEFEHLSSPLRAFIDHCCITGSRYSIRVEEIYAAYKRWASEISGRKHLALHQFGVRLHAALPTLKRTRNREDGSRSYTYAGIALNEEWMNKMNPQPEIPYIE